MALTSQVMSAGKRISSFVGGETSDHFLSRESVLVLAGDGAIRSVPIGTLVARRLFGDVTIAADGGNTGDGGITAATLGRMTEIGDYVLTCVVAAVDGGTFSLITPSGVRLGDVEVGTAYQSQHLNFTLSDGPADFVMGDQITVTVAAGDGKIVALDHLANDGSQIPVGLLMNSVTAPDGTDERAVLIKSHALFLSSELIWPDGADDAFKALSIKALNDRDITVGDSI